MNLNIFVPGLESYMEDINITNNVNTEAEEAPVETSAEEVKEEPTAEVTPEEAPKAEDAPAETAEEVDEQKEELFVSFWK